MVIDKSIFKYDMCRIKCCMDIKKNLWDDYSDKFNLLSDKMSEARIDLNLLTDLIKSYEDLPETYKNTGF
jgi:hypothetical protein